MKRLYIITVAVCLAMLLAFGAVYSIHNVAPYAGVLKVGFLFENDETTPYTYNFALAREELKKQYGDRVELLSRTNVPVKETEEPLKELARLGCGIIFACTRSEQVMSVAESFPGVQFCQVSRADTQSLTYPENYHTFNAESYQGRYVCGIAAGMKLKTLIQRGELNPEAALVGFVGAMPCPEVFSACTAFLLGVRSVAPEANMRVRYVGAWCSYGKEKACAEALIDDGCVVIAQNTHTVGPAVACELASTQRRVYHVGQDLSLLDIAPASSLISARVDWSPYVLSAVDAVLTHEIIERHATGHIHGQDVSGGFGEGWVQMLELNKQNAAEGTLEVVERAVEALRRDKLEVFKGPYTGVDPDHPEDTIDLSRGWPENARSSAPTFHYLLKDIVEAA